MPVFTRPDAEIHDEVRRVTDFLTRHTPAS